MTTIRINKKEMLDILSEYMEEHYSVFIADINFLQDLGGEGIVKMYEEIDYIDFIVRNEK